MKIKITSRKADPLQKLFQAPPTFQQRVEVKKLRIVEMILRQMESLGMNRKRLAEKMGVGPSRITSMLDGTNNFTLETMMKAADAVDSEVELTIAPKTHRVKWITHLEEDCHAAFKPKISDRAQNATSTFSIEPGGIGNSDPCHAA